MASLIVYTTTDDCFWQKDDANYNTAHDAAESDSIYTSSSGLVVWWFGASGNYEIRRIGLFFDTSDLPDNRLVIQAVLSLKMHDSLTYITGHIFDLVIVSGEDLALPPVVAGYGGLLNKTVSLGSINSVDMPEEDDAWRDITLNSLGLAAINKQGITKFGLRVSDDIDNNLPVEDFYWMTFYSRDSGISVAPKLTIAYGTPGYIWTGGDKLHFTSEKYKQGILGVDTTTNATAGHLHVEGNYLHFVSQNGDERRQMGKLTGRFGYTAGQVQISDMWLYYIDSSGYERKLGTFMLGQSHLGVDTILKT